MVEHWVCDPAVKITQILTELLAGAHGLSEALLNFLHIRSFTVPAGGRQLSNKPNTGKNNEFKIHFAAPVRSLSICCYCWGEGGIARLADMTKGKPGFTLFLSAQAYLPARKPLWIKTA